MKLRRVSQHYREGDDIVPSNLSKAAVETYASKVRVAASFRSGDDLGQLIDALGGRVHFQDLDEWLDEDGSIFVHGPADFDILLPRYTSPLRDRFTLAHELRHYFLHSQQGEAAIVAYRKGSKRIEWEANWFAAGLLMPADEFRAACNAATDISAIAAKFGVSRDAAAVRQSAVCG